MKLIDNTKIDLSNLNDKIYDAITWSYECQQSVRIGLDKEGKFGRCEGNCYSPTDIFDFYLDYGFSQQFEIDLHNEYLHRNDKRYEALYEKYENGDLENSSYLLDYLEEEDGSKYNENALSKIIEEEKEKFLSELHNFLNQEETKLKAIILRVCKNLERNNEYFLKDSVDEIYENVKEELKYESLESESLIKDYIIRNHVTPKEEEH